MKQQTTLPVMEGTASKIDRLLQRVEGVKRGSDIPRPTRFNREGERHARRVAQADQSRGAPR